MRSCVDLSVDLRAAIHKTRQEEESGGRGCLGGAGSPPAASVVPPHGNTGGKLTVSSLIEVGMGWLNVTFPRELLDVVEGVLSVHLGNAVERSRGQITYERSKGFETGALLAWTDGRPEAWASINADSLACFPSCWQLVVELRDLGCKCTRVDCNADDVNRLFLDLAEIDRQALAGNVVGFKRYDPRRTVANVHTGELEGFSCNFGRRGSDGSGRYVRIYDKRLESKGLTQAVRVEVEFSGRQAITVFEILANADDEDEFRRCLGRFAGGCIDFRERGNHIHLARMPQLSWWQSFVEAIGSSRVSVDRPVPPLQKSLEHHTLQWSCNLALLQERAELMGYDGEAIVVAYLRRMVDEGKRRAADRGPGPRVLSLDLESLIGADRMPRPRPRVVPGCFQH